MQPTDVPTHRGSAASAWSAGWDYADVLVTDESNLADFADMTGDRDIEVTEMFARMAAHYRITGRPHSTRIVDLLELLASHGVTG